MYLYLQFPQREAEKGERREHQAREEDSTPLGCGRKLCMWSGAHVGLGRTLHNGSAQSATGFGGQFGNVDFPEKIVAVGETQKLE